MCSRASAAACGGSAASTCAPSAADIATIASAMSAGCSFARLWSVLSTSSGFSSARASLCPLSPDVIPGSFRPRPQTLARESRARTTRRRFSHCSCGRARSPTRRRKPSPGSSVARNSPSLRTTASFVGSPTRSICPSRSAYTTFGRASAKCSPAAIARPASSMQLTIASSPAARATEFTCSASAIPPTFISLMFTMSTNSLRASRNASRSVTRLSSAITGIDTERATSPSSSGSPLGVGCSRSSSFAERVLSTNCRASSTVYPWFASNRSSISGPTASRTFRIRAISSSTSCPPLIFKQRKPLASQRFAAATVSASGRIPIVTLVAMDSR